MGVSVAEPARVALSFFRRFVRFVAVDRFGVLDPSGTPCRRWLRLSQENRVLRHVRIVANHQDVQPPLIGARKLSLGEKFSWTTGRPAPVAASCQRPLLSKYIWQTVENQVLSTCCAANRECRAC